MARILAAAAASLLFPLVAARSVAQEGPAASALGLTLQGLPARDLRTLEEALGRRLGVLVARVAPDSPARAAGLEAGDILIAAGGAAVASPQELERILVGPPGPLALFGLRTGRDGAFLPLKVALNLPPGTPAPNPGSNDQERSWTHPIGFSFRYPPSWSVKPVPDGLQLLPPHPGAGGEGPTEVYFIGGRAGLGAATEPRVALTFDREIRDLAPSLSRTKAPAPIGQGVLLEWRGRSPGGQPILARTYVTIAGGRTVALVGLGLQDQVTRRDGDLRRIFGSIAIGEARLDPRLLGPWVHESAYISGGFTGRTTRVLSIRQDGSFLDRSQASAGLDTADPATGTPTAGIHADTGLSPGQRGRWGAADGRLHLWWEDGSTAEYGYIVEARPDGKAMLTTSPDGKRLLWRTR